MNANDLFKAVTQLDLTPIKTKLMHVQSGEGWSLEKANAVEKEYRRFLCLMKLFPEEDTAPLVDVDTFWHYHILDTMKYAADCEQVFGYFLHHYPHIGLGDSEEEDLARLESGDRMRQLYEATFGEGYRGWATGVVEADDFPADPADGALNAGAIAFSAGPRQIAGAIAFSAGPRQIAGAIAFSAGPRTSMLNAGITGKASAIAFSAGPRQGDPNARATGKASAIAFSAGPRQIASAIAFSAGPRIAKPTAGATSIAGTPGFGGGPAAN
jgi:hypothetical protein